jgi:hypothetical protein
MNDITRKTGNGGLVQLDPEKFAAHLTRAGEGEQSGGDWVGKLLKFKRGQFKAGKEDTVIPIGTELVVALDSYQLGWQRWADGACTNSMFGYVCEGYARPKREELGDNDPAMWPVDPTTKQKRDPWQKASRVVMYKTRGDEDTIYTFSALSVGGIGALGKLGEQAGRLIRMHPGSYPIVKLKADHYKHSKLNTDVDFPVFELVGWDPNPWVGAAVRKEAA